VRLRRTDEDDLTQATLTLAGKYARYGYRRITALLQRGVGARRRTSVNQELVSRQVTPMKGAWSVVLSVRFLSTLPAHPVPKTVLQEARKPPCEIS